MLYLTANWAGKDLVTAKKKETTVMRKSLAKKMGVPKAEIGGQEVKRDVKRRADKSPAAIADTAVAAWCSVSDEAEVGGGRRKGVGEGREGQSEW